ncbi:MAG: prephenate dehydrogenase [Campylobacter sp.]|nr:prephenate dehydrogenase [Campylobacter sp.]
MKIGVIGLGLIGGSLGLCLRQMKLVNRVYGYDISKENEKEALNLGLVDEIISFDSIKEICDIIFLAIPVEAIIDTLYKLKDIKETTTIIDLGSTKLKIIKHCPAEIRSNLVASHPMAGTENSGPKAAFKELLKDAVVVICDEDNSGSFHVKRAIEIFSYAGMRIIFMDSTRHDHHVALISHLPHIVSYALVNSVLKSQNRKNVINLAGGSFSDVSRIAKSSPEMWVDVFRQNRENVINSVSAFRDELEICEKMIKEERWDELKEWLYDARVIREFL